MSTSISVDDLISSLSSSHIGQEAMDLAALQAQLAETLFGSSSAFASSSSSSTTTSCSRFASAPRGRDHQPCNTPTPRTPSACSSFQWESIDAYVGAARSRSSSISAARAVEDAEDELMVEELLLLPPPPAPSPMYDNNAGNHNSFSSFANAASFVQPSTSTSSSSTTTPSSTYYQPSASAFPSFHRSASASTSMMSSEPAVVVPSPTQSLFTSADPFYLQAQANAQAYFYGNSNITQHGRPSQASPFVQVGGTPWNGGHGYHQMHMGVAPTAAAF